MADQEQVQRLLKNVKEWNRWRAEHPEEELNFNGADLSHTDLSGADLSHADFSYAHLIGTKLNSANLMQAYLSGADLYEIDLIKANLHYAHLIGADLRSADLNHANLSKANFTDADLGRATLRDADLRGANLSHANIRQASLSSANLRGANLSSAILNNAYLKGADLRSANLTYTNLDGANLDETNLNEAHMGWTSFGDRDLRKVIGLETMLHVGPSPLSINTLYLSEGAIPENFLKGIGAPNTFIEYIKALTKQPIEYYTCFISYSSKDELFARRLHNDLQQEGVRCWFAPEDMDVGDKIKHRIDESIRMYDKLLLILSEYSIASSWVAYEVERALKKEPKGTQNVLYPVRVDTAILTCTTNWAEDIKETRHIGDFEAWTDPVKYEASFKRLLRALNAKKGDQGKR